MRFKIWFALFATACLLVSTASYGADSSTLMPSAFLPADKFEFPPVLEGNKVIHDFIIQNKGNAVLEITNVRTG